MEYLQKPVTSSSFLFHLSEAFMWMDTSVPSEWQVPVIVHKQTQDSQMLSHVVNSITMIENAQCCTFAVCQFQQYRFTHCCMWYWLQYCKRLDNYSFIGGLTTNYSRMSWWYKAKDKTHICAYCIYICNVCLCIHTQIVYIYIHCMFVCYSSFHKVYLLTLTVVSSQVWKIEDTVWLYLLTSPYHCKAMIENMVQTSLASSTSFSVLPPYHSITQLYASSS